MNVEVRVRTLPERILIVDRRNPENVVVTVARSLPADVLAKHARALLTVEERNAVRCRLGLPPVCNSPVVVVEIADLLTLAS